MIDPNAKPVPHKDLPTGKMPKLLAALGLPKSGRTLQIRLGAEQGDLDRIARAAGNVHLAIQTAPAKGRTFGRSAQIVGSDPFNVDLPGDLSLCAVDLGIARTPDVFEELLYDRIHPALSDGGIAVLAFPLDVTARSLTAQGVKSENARANLQAFLKKHFGALALPDVGPVKNLFDRCAYFELKAWAVREQTNTVWLALRKRAPRAEDRAFLRSRRVDQFDQSEFAGFLETLQDRQVELLAADAFASRLRDYHAKKKRKGPSRFGHAKFDIHGNMRRPLEIARVMHAAGYPGLFLMMQRHPINETFFDSETTWDTLREIRDMGHEIGLHADVFHFIRVYGDLYKGVEDALAQFHRRGFAIRSITLHGDTAAHIKSQRLHAIDFFGKTGKRLRWNGTPPAGEEFLAEHVHKYSRRKLWRDFGIEFFSELAFTRRGLPVGKSRLLYATDNSRSLGLSRPIKKTRRKAPVPFRIDADLAAKLAQKLARRPFLMLTHPQWYW
jgi:hypothetical protein